MEKSLWEILVPVATNDGKPISLEVHRDYDERVRAISHGLTILSPVKGEWQHKGKLFAERMIPVRVLATREEIDRIVDMTIAFYEQMAVMAYRISNDVILRHRKES